MDGIRRKTNSKQSDGLEVNILSIDGSTSNMA